MTTFDVPGVFLQPEMPLMKNSKDKDGEILMTLCEDIFVDIMYDVNLEYEDCVVYEKGRKVLYLHVLRSIYGCIGAAFL